MSGKKRKSSVSYRDSPDYDNETHPSSGSSWSCPVCTFINKPKDFKCQMCQCRKGTSTRKATINDDIIKQQAQVEKLITKNHQASVERSSKRRSNVSESGVISKDLHDSNTTSNVSTPSSSKAGSVSREGSTILVSGVSAVITEFEAADIKVNLDE
ncbi:Zinc finger, RanBP2-type domain-containing protein [Strongyloides ratti]|uniref:Zinc finger, RanBP2-type domain-containing protein n=1 Tax=Strongyloides ratti TaxID=34506 RepID=A0A090KWJ9_STRRB|nr:Zinc finger, RanBP2-type domain-containing protein [Strongyloides ratti]CEF61786.1 Zinc finger, RanBP2-type domain-containing protein [Strongyloides ratti]